MNATPVIGLAGIGRMGFAMATRLLDRGFSVAVWNRSPGRLNDLVARGAVQAETPADLASRCDVVLTSLPDERALDDVYLGPNGLLLGQNPATLFVDTSTVLPATAVRLGSECESRGFSFIDAPVLGTVTPARAGQLIVLVGGSVENMQRARPVLDTVGRVVHHVGATGAGVAMKLAVNVLMASYWAAMADGFAIARACGLSAEKLVEIVVDSPAALAQLPPKLPILLGKSQDVGFDINGVAKDCALIRQLAQFQCIELPVLEAAWSQFATAAEAGWGRRDVAALPRLGLVKGEDSEA